ncbi:telomere recombination-domain-containing protein [Coniochaeta sp. 2T2.1]|nr:telomere recombination-domain-containing protein [Coniochaeta sp. 2T2.1]
MKTQILKVTTPPDQLGHFFPSLPSSSSPLSHLTKWAVPPSTASDPALALAAQHLRTTDIPVAFPTETVYGLGADATRSEAVRGIYTAKGRPSDNPLIVHVCDLDMLRDLLRPTSTPQTNGFTQEEEDPIPPIYAPLIARFWPGPLTILLPNPPSPSSKLAPEVTAGLPTFGARMPASPLARSLISLAGAPLAAPSANASTRPSPTSARHVADDLEGKISLILDGGEPCGVGVESTVVDGLCSPPVVLRPGGVGIDELRTIEGWEGVQKAYKDGAEVGGKSAPRAPGMKYKHYSPRARVVLYERGFRDGGFGGDDVTEVVGEVEGEKKVVGVIRTLGGEMFGGLKCGREKAERVDGEGEDRESGLMLDVVEGEYATGGEGATVLDLDLGGNARTVAQGLFAGLRELDRRGADIIFVEGVGDGDGIAAAVMNRLRKAASVIKA